MGDVPYIGRGSIRINNLGARDNEPFHGLGVTDDRAYNDPIWTVNQKETPHPPHPAHEGLGSSNRRYLVLD